MLSPLDDRYYSQVSSLEDYFSENALYKNRLLIETKYVIALTDFLKKESLSPNQKRRLLTFANSLSPKDFAQIKKIDSEIRHDVKATEIFFRQSLPRLHLTKLSPWLHWGLTSEDVNNLAYSLTLQKAKDHLLFPQHLALTKLLLKLARQYASTAIPARTHGQLAVPTTLGKELVVFASRASFYLEKLHALKLSGKLNGAVGNFNAHYQIFPHKNWFSFSRRFVQSLGLDYTLISTQIEPAVRTVYLFDLMRALNNIWLDLAKDLWLYFAFDYLSQKPVSREVGSSTMPHKINPIDFENAEGNFELVNQLLMLFSNKLPLSRLQRDLSDSTVKRNYGVAFAHNLLALSSLTRGLSQIKPNHAVLNESLSSHPEMLSEALQLYLKAIGKPDSYDKIKLITRGQSISWEGLINKLNLPANQTALLLKWQVTNYTGIATKLTNLEVSRLNLLLKRLI